MNDRELVDRARDARAEGIETAENAADPRVKVMIDDAIAEANASGDPWSVNDIRRRFPVVSPGLVGARVRAAMMRRPREMVRVASTPSTLENTHAKDVSVWVGAQHMPADPGVDLDGLMDLADAITAVSAGADHAHDLVKAGLPPLDGSSARHLLGQCRRARFRLGSVEDALYGAARDGDQ